LLRPGQAVRENRAAFPLPFIYYFGDWDKHGVNISNDIERKLNGFGANVSFERVTVLPWQIEDWQLPTRPTKDVGWGDCVEVDASQQAARTGHRSHRRTY